MHYRSFVIGLIIITVSSLGIAAATEQGTQPTIILSKLEAQQQLNEIDMQIAQLEQQLDDEALTDEQTAKITVQLQQAEEDKNQFTEQQRVPMFNLLGGPAYTPELGALVAIGGLYSFSTDRYDHTLQRSNVGGFLVANKGDGDMGLAVRGSYNLFFIEDNIRFSGNLRAGQQSEHFWGVGFAAGEAQDSSDNTLINSFSVDYFGSLGFKVADQLYLGPVLNLNYYHPDDDELPLTAADPNFVDYQRQDLAMGIGFAVQYDSRDVAVNAWSGQYFNFEYLAYRKGAGSDVEFDRITVEHRYYHSFASGRVIATLNKLHWSDGDVPYYAMAKLGGVKSMRGLYMGRFRNENSAEHTIEYRHTFYNGDNSLSDHGMVLWAGIGSISASFQNLYRDTLVSGGVGYRYQLQPRMNVRLDFGISEYDSGFYFNFTEAF